MSEAALQVSDAAIAKLQQMKDAGRLDASAVRVSVFEEGAAFRYELKVVPEDSGRAGDAVVETSAVRFFVGSESVPLLRGASLDHVDTLSETGFKFDNPNRPRLLENPLAARVQRVLDERINPSVASHGGHVRLIDVQEGRVFLQLGGGCQGCGMADVTLRQGIEETLRREVPEIEEILDTTDHAAGENPYYTG
jgi:Fe/S biogenesis protein NfuA